MMDTPNTKKQRGLTGYWIGGKAARFIEMIRKKSSSDERTFLTRAEVALLLEVSPSSISRWARQGRLPYNRTLGGRCRYPKDDILRLIKDRMEPGQNKLPSQYGGRRKEVSGGK